MKKEKMALGEKSRFIFIEEEKCHILDLLNKQTKKQTVQQTKVRSQRKVMNIFCGY